MYNEISYGKIKEWFNAKDYRIKLLKFVCKVFPLLVYIGYPLLLLYLMITWDSRILESITVPLGVFVTVTLIRKFMNFERPYECLNIEPLMQKDTKGLSFPSRHTASAAVIGMTFLYINIPLGIIYLSIALFIGLSRICAGVHFPRDVIAGFLYAVVMSVFFFYVVS